MTDLRKLVAAIERQKPEILDCPAWKNAAAGNDYTLDRPLLLGLMMVWATEHEEGRFAFAYGREFKVTRISNHGDDHPTAHFPDLFAAWAWVCGVEVDDD